MVVRKDLKGVTFIYKEDTKTLWINTFKNPNGLELPRHTMVSLMRFGLRILQKGRPKKR
jgi:hypothetical protein